MYLYDHRTSWTLFFLYLGHSYALGGRSARAKRSCRLIMYLKTEDKINRVHIADHHVGQPRGDEKELGLRNQGLTVQLTVLQGEERRSTAVGPEIQ